MSKNIHQSLSKKSKNQRGFTAMKNKQKVHRSTLKDILHKVYYDTINLETNCAGRCECCKVSCPSMNECEAEQLITEVWSKENKESKINLICTSIEYFFKNEFEKWGMETMIKPCMLLDKNGKCGYYLSRPLSCRLYGLWPEKTYKDRVNKFEKAYKGLLKREDLPLNTQCPYVKMVDASKKLTPEIIEILYKHLDDIDLRVMRHFSEVQISQKENYRTFHDWLLLKVLGEQFLTTMTTFILAADKTTMEDQIVQIKKAVREKFIKEMPNLRE